MRALKLGKEKCIKQDCKVKQEKYSINWKYLHTLEEVSLCHFFIYIHSHKDADLQILNVHVYSYRAGRGKHNQTAPGLHQLKVYNTAITIYAGQQAVIHA